MVKYFKLNGKILKMKKLILLLLILSGVNVYAQKIKLPLQDSTIVYENVVKLKDTTTNADKLFSFAQTWFANTFKNPKSVLLINDRHSAKLIGKGAILCSPATAKLPAAYLYYLAEVVVKNGRYRYRFYGISYDFGHGETDLSTAYQHYKEGNLHKLAFESKNGAAKRYEDYFNFADKNITQLISSLTTGMNGTDADNTF